MPQLDLLVSPPGTGKTTFCVDRFRAEIEKSHSGIDSRSYFVLPSREHAGRIQNLLLKKGVTGFFNAHVITFNELAARFSDGSALPPPPDSVRSAVARGILAEEAAAGNLAYFSRVADAKGFARALASFFSEMRRGLASTADFEKWSQPLIADPVFRLKFRDLSILAKRCEAELRARGYAQSEERLSDEIAASADLVIFDGFYRFTRAQLALIGHLARGARQILVTLTAADDAAKRRDVFAHVLETRSALEKIGFRAGWKAGQPERRAARREIIEAPNAREEMRAVAREIRRLYRTEPFHWSDFAVILRSVEPYRKILEAAFAEFEIPVHIHERRKLMEQGLAQLLVRFLRLIREDWRESDVAYVLLSSLWSGRSGPAGAGLEWVRAARAAGVRDGRSAWEALAPPEEMSAQARERLACLLDEEQRLRAAKSRSEFARRLRGWLRPLETPDDSLVFSAIEEVLERFGRAEEGAGVFSAAQAAEELTDAVEAALYSEKPRGRNRVQVYDVVMALPKEYKAVFVSGLAEKIFPKEAIEEPVLRDAERRVINECAGATVFEERAARLAGERYFFYIACTRARERTVLTYPAAGLDGRPVLPSVFVDDTLRSDAGIAMRRTAAEEGPEFWEGRREAEAGDACAEFRRTGAAEPVAAIGTEEVRRAFAEESRVFSPSSLEALVACRFRFFSSKLLGLKTLPEDREAAEQGTVFHEALQKFFESFSRQELASADAWKRPEALETRLAAALDRAFSENDYFKRVPVWRRTVLLAQMRRALRRFLKEESEFRSARGFVPAYFERKFGYDAPFEIGGLPVRGIIDRIDLSADGRSALVVDYKSSKTNFVSKIGKGLELQMPIYWIAAETTLGVRVAGVEHRHLRDGAKPEGRIRSEYKSLIPGSRAWTEEEINEILRRTVESAAAAAGLLRTADIAVRPKSCEYCDYSPVCRFEKWKLIYRSESA